MYCIVLINKNEKLFNICILYYSNYLFEQSHCHHKSFFIVIISCSF